MHWNPLSLIICVTEVSEPILCIIHLFEKRTVKKKSENYLLVILNHSKIFLFKDIALHLQPEVLETSAKTPSSGHSSSSQHWIKLFTHGEENTFVVPPLSCAAVVAPRLF